VRRILIIVGGALVALGLLAAVLAFALPWASYRMRLRRGGWAEEDFFSVFEIRRGTWFVVALVLLMVLALAAAVGVERVRQVAGMAAPVVGLIAAALVVAVMQSQIGDQRIEVELGGLADARVRWAGGAVFGLAATPLLGFGAGLLSIGRTRGA